MSHGHAGREGKHKTGVESARQVPCRQGQIGQEKATKHKSDDLPTPDENQAVGLNLTVLGLTPYSEEGTVDKKRQTQEWPVCLLTLTLRKALDCFVRGKRVEDGTDWRGRNAIRDFE